MSTALFIVLAPRGKTKRIGNGLIIQWIVSRLKIWLASSIRWRSADLIEHLFCFLQKRLQCLDFWISLTFRVIIWIPRGKARNICSIVVQNWHLLYWDLVSFVINTSQIGEREKLTLLTCFITLTKTSLRKYLVADF